jgi:hypothetical protein
MPTIMHSNVWQQTTTLFLTIAMALNKKKEKRGKPEKETNQHKQQNCSLHKTLYTLQDNFRMTLQGAKVSLLRTHKRTLKVNNKCLE